MEKYSAQELKVEWMRGSSYQRSAIVAVLEERGEVRTLMDCLHVAKVLPYNKYMDSSDLVMIIESLGRLGDKRAIKAISELFAYWGLQEKEVASASLEAYRLIGSREASTPIRQFMSSYDDEVLWQSLDVLGQLGAADAADAVSECLFSNNPDIRWKALHTLVKISGEESVSKVSLLLNDEDKEVRQSACSLLLGLGVDETQLQEWKKSSKAFTIDDIVSSRRDYHRVLAEKEVLETSLEEEIGLKEQLEKSLSQRDKLVKEQTDSLNNLYEEERQLKSKLAQLQITNDQSSKYQEQLANLRQKVENASKAVSTANTEESLELARKQLQEAQDSKIELEKQTRLLDEKSTRLSEEVKALQESSELSRQEAERLKTELVSLRDRESELTGQIEELKKELAQGSPPILIISTPHDGQISDAGVIVLQFVGIDDGGIRDITIRINGETEEVESERGLQITAGEQRELERKISITRRVELKEGQNRLEVVLTDDEGLSTAEQVVVTRQKERGRIWAIVVGVNDYPRAGKLRYAVNDARGVETYFKENVGIPEEQIFTLLDGDATKTNILSLLGTRLKKRAKKDDTVIIFYAGHGAIETDPSNPDGDGFEKYLLPYDADLNDLFTTAISMNEIRTIFDRIRSDRVIFLADTCYSGASGGRTLRANNYRASLSDNFLERLSKGRGRVIVTSSSANEISKEDDQLQHGIFTYYLLQGLGGAADTNADQLISVSELFSYLSRKVPDASGQDQHPVRKGESEGELIIGYVR